MSTFKNSKGIVFLFFLFSIQFLITNESMATVRRVGYWGIPVAGVDYATFALAQTASSAGDTIYLFRNNYSSITINKQLVIIGTGYLLDSLLTGDTKGNSFQQNFKTTAIAQMVFETGSNGSKVYGLECLVNIGSSGASNTSNVEIHRCNFSQGNLTLYGISSNIKIYNCLFNQSVSIINSGTATTTNLKIYNCIVKGMTEIINWSGASATGEIVNCTIGGVTINSAGTFVINNNIIRLLSTLSGNTTNQNCVFNNNLIRGIASNYPTLIGSNNVFVDNATFDVTGTVLVGWPSQLTYSADNRYKLSPTSPAIGIGIGGVDAGAFGGALPYKLSGIPDIPTIYNMSSPQGNNPSGNTITINFSTKGNN